MNFRFIDGGDHRTVISLEMGQSIVCGLAAAVELCNYLLDLCLLSGGASIATMSSFLGIEDIVVTFPVKK